MNKADSELMASSMARSGFEEAAGQAGAGVVIFNTCSVREHAEGRALARIRSARSASRAGDVVVAVAGCMAQRLGDRLLEGGLADVVVGPYQSPDIGPIIEDYLNKRGGRLFLSQKSEDFRNRIDPGPLPREGVQPWHRWISIAHGCGNRCAYCVVPDVRGPLISFPSGDILSYIARCASSGIREITLLGQNVNQYGSDSGDMPFHRLLEKAARVPGLLKINFLTSHPADFSAEITAVMRDFGNISRAVHLPLQSGSDRVLASMNRRYTLAHYLGVVENIHSELEDCSLSTDLIVGFPGETAADYALTLKAVRDIRFDEAFMYAYSPREGTPAYRMEESISREEKGERLQELIALQRSISLEKLRSRLNRTERLMVEGRSKKSAHEVMGKTFLNHPAVTPGGPEDVGRTVNITVKEVRGSTLYGERIA